jgi:Holliday junction resolvase
MQPPANDETLTTHHFALCIRGGAEMVIELKLTNAERRSLNANVEHVKKLAVWADKHQAEPGAAIHRIIRFSLQKKRVSDHADSTH